MITRKHRFHGHKSVSRVRGPSVHTPLFSIRYAQNKRDNFRIAVVVSKKVSLKAVLRNRIRRRLFETIRQQGRFTGVSVDLVVYAKTDALAGVDQAELENELIKSSKKILQSLDHKH